MKILITILVALSIFGGAYGNDRIQNLAERYDYVGIVTHIAIAKWNTTGDRKMSPVDSSKVPKGSILVGIIKVPHDNIHPYVGILHIDGWLFTKELQVGMRKGKGALWEGWEGEYGEDVARIRFIRKGEGYRGQ